MPSSELVKALQNMMDSVVPKILAKFRAQLDLSAEELLALAEELQPLARTVPTKVRKSIRLRGKTSVPFPENTSRFSRRPDLQPILPLPTPKFNKNSVGVKKVYTTVQRAITPLTSVQIAEACGVNRKYVSSALTLLARKNYVERNGRYGSFTYSIRRAG
jgi:predicted transcriptional regulator